MVEYRVGFNFFSTEWSSKAYRGERIFDVQFPSPISASDSLVMYSTSAQRLIDGMRTLTGKVTVDSYTVVRYEFWAQTDKSASWSLDSPNSMKYAGISTFFNGNHRIVISDRRQQRPRTSVIIFEPKDVYGDPNQHIVQAQDVPILELLRMAAARAATKLPKQREGVGSALEVFVTDICPALVGLVV